VAAPAPLAKGAAPARADAPLAGAAPARPGAARGARAAAALACLGAAFGPSAARADEAPARPATVDRVVVVFEAPETGGGASPNVIFERELAFAARVEALAAGEPLDDETGPYARRHLRAALDRYVATTILAALPVERTARLAPHPCDGTGARPATGDLARRVALARVALVTRAGGERALRRAAAAEGLDDDDLDHFARREALAARYLDVMVSPMLAPSEADVRAFGRSLAAAPASPDAAPRAAADACATRHALIARRLGGALVDFWQSARQRVRLRAVAPP
jgi:hypothetical protein